MSHLHIFRQYTALMLHLRRISFSGQNETERKQDRTKLTDVAVKHQSTKACWLVMKSRTFSYQRKPNSATCIRYPRVNGCYALTIHF